MPDTAAPAFAWPPPVIPGRWRELGASEAISLAARLGNALGPEAGRLVWHTLVLGVRATPLSFYKDWLLVEFAARLESEARIGLACFLYGPGMQLVMLDLSSAPIHDVNHQHLLPLATPELAADYLRFFCGFITGDDGRFRVVESPADVPLSPGANGASAPAKTVTPLKLTPLQKPDAKHAWKAEGFVLYGAVLCGVTWEIVDGQVEMTHDDQIGLLPVQPETLAPPFRFPA
jgi:hypothetical protein